MSARRPTLPGQHGCVRRGRRPAPSRPYTQLMRAQDDDTDAVVTRLNDRTVTDDELLSTELNLDPVAQEVFERRTVHGTGNGEGSGS